MLARGACFFAGIAVVAAGDLLGDGSLTLHMASHGLAVAVGAPLIVLSRPVTLLLRGLPRPAARSLAALMRSPVLRALLWPPLALLAFVAVQLGFHLTPLFERALVDEPLHAAEHLLFLATALWLWTVCLVVEPLPRRWSPLPRAALLMAAMMLSDIGAVRLMLDGETAAGAAMVVSMMPLGLGAVAVLWIGIVREERLESRRGSAAAARREAAHAAG
jgi:putative membrane protein